MLERVSTSVLPRAKVVLNKWKSMWPRVASKVGNRRFGAFFTVGILLLLVACTSGAKREAEAKHAALKRRMLEHPTRSVGQWSGWLEKPIEKRFGAAPPELIEFLHLDNEYQGWSQRPRPHEPDGSMRRDLTHAIAGLPKPIRETLERKLVGFFLVNNLGGSAYTNSIVGEKNTEEYAIMVLDSSVLSRTANEWATFKESSPYTTDPRIRIEAEIADEGSDDRERALRYIILHEAGHVIQVGRTEIPSFNSDPRKDFDERRFSLLSWKLENEKIVSRYAATTFPQGPLIHYYASNEKARPIKEAAGDLRALAKTNFPSLYASTNPYDDFAEAVASYAHTVWLKEPWSVRVIEDGKVTAELVPCWGQPRCAEKEKSLLAILRDEASN